MSVHDDLILVRMQFFSKCPTPRTSIFDRKCKFTYWSRLSVYFFQLQQWMTRHPNIKYEYLTLETFLLYLFPFYFSFNISSLLSPILIVRWEFFHLVWFVNQKRTVEIIFKRQKSNFFSSFVWWWCKYFWAYFLVEKYCVSKWHRFFFKLFARNFGSFLSIPT